MSPSNTQRKYTSIHQTDSANPRYPSSARVCGFRSHEMLRQQRWPQLWQVLQCRRLRGMLDRRWSGQPKRFGLENERYYWSFFFGNIGIYKICHPCRYCVDLYKRCYVGHQSWFKWCIIIWEIFLVSWVEFSCVDQLQGVLREQQNSSRCTVFNVMWKCKVVIPLRVWILIYTDFWYCARTTTILDTCWEFVHLIYTYVAIPVNFQVIFEC